MPPSAAVEQLFRSAIERSIVPAEHVVLAVSGGRDSMALLDAAARWAHQRIATVATFDHGTGDWAAAAADLVQRVGGERGLRVLRGRALPGLRGEAEWRAARWDFLRRAAADANAVIATAHTRDDQVETVLMRVLRGAGARGLAGLYAPSAVLRPMIDLGARDVLEYASTRGLKWLDDPTNRSRAFLRNRIRLDVLPVLTRARPSLPAELLHLSRQAAELRAEIEAFVRHAIPLGRARGDLHVARADLLCYDAPALALLWPAIAAGAGIILDRRGTQRIISFTISGRDGERIQLSGGFEAVLHRGVLRLRRVRSSVTGTTARPLENGLRVGEWRFRTFSRPARASLWTAALPVDRTLTVRGWLPGDRMLPRGAAVPRRVKGLLRDAGIDAALRAGWPVVLAGGEIVWIPGVRRSSAATARSGRPVALYACERIDR
ncbi:MAG: tRNA lysidine(34) synthetase TilS [Gemmatimonadaceae bacterium]